MKLNQWELACIEYALREVCLILGDYKNGKEYN